MMRSKTWLVLFVVLLACNDEKFVNTPPVASFDSSDGIDRIILNGTLSHDQDNQPLSYTWTATDNSIVIAEKAKGKYFFKIPNGAPQQTVDVTLTVNDGSAQDVHSQTVDVPAFSMVRSYGLGKNLDKEVSNDVPYEWYLDQANSGTWSLVNCGPTSVTMAIKWFNQNFTGTPQDARNTYRPSGGWWYTDDIINYLDQNGVNQHTIVLDDINKLRTEIDEGNIVILCLDMFKVGNPIEDDHHLNKFYETQAIGWGHFIILKGYKIVDGKVLYEAYDPYSLSRRYVDGGLKGRDRYYSSQDLDDATAQWWDFAIIIQKDGSVGGRKGVDVSKIIHMPGR